MLRYGIIPMSAPGMTTANPFQAQPAAVHSPVLLYCLYHILRAGGRMAAGIGQVRRNSPLIETNQAN